MILHLGHDFLVPTPKRSSQQARGASQELGITKKAWSARWMRAKSRLAQIETRSTTTPGSKTSKTAKEDDEEDTDDNVDAEGLDNPST